MKKATPNCDLTRCQLCQRCLPAWKPAIAAHRQVLTYKKGELIFEQGNRLTGIYYIYEGTAKVYKNWGDGRELIVRFAQKGDILGHRGLGSDTVYPVSGVALEPVTACFIPIDFFMATLQANQQFAVDMLLFFAAELKESEYKMNALILLPVKERLMMALQMLRNKFGTDADGCIDLTISRQDLASYVGTTYESVFRMLQELQHTGTIKLEGKRIGLVDEAAFAAAHHYLQAS